MLTFEIAEPGGDHRDFLAKVPGATMELGAGEAWSSPTRTRSRRGTQLEAYERLIHDAMIGDRTLFNRADGIERLWEIAAPLLENPPPVRPYAPGSWGPEAIRTTWSLRGAGTFPTAAESRGGL